MSLSNTAENAILNYIFMGTDVSWNGNTDLYFALHSADPGEAGTAITSEAAYGGYARVALTRATDFTITGDTVSNTNQEAFPQCSSGSETLSYVSIVTSASGAGTIILRAALNSPITVSTGVQPLFAASSLTFTAN